MGAARRVAPSASPRSDPTTASTTAMTTSSLLLDGIWKLSVSLWPAHATNMTSSTQVDDAAGRHVEADAGHGFGRRDARPSAGSGG